MEVNNNSIAQYAYITGELQKRADAGKELAYIHLIEPRYTATGYFNNIVKSEGSNSFVRSIWKGIFMRSGGYDCTLTIKQTDKDDKVLIAMGRYFISTPDLVSRWEQKIELNSYNITTFYFPGNPGYTDCPFATELKVKS